MAFGQTSNQAKNTTQSKSFDPVFLSLPVGERIVRFLGDEVQVKRYFYPCIVDGKPLPKPVIVARTELQDDGTFAFMANWGKEWRDNPIADAYEVLEPDYKTRGIKGLLEQTRFYVNVLDRTLVLLDRNKVIYPEIYQDKDGNVKKEFESLGDPLPHNLVMVLEQSSGKEGGEHFYGKLQQAGKSLRSFKTGKPINMENSDFRIVGTESEKTWNGKPVTNRVIQPWINQEPLDEELSSLPLYDLYTWLKPYPLEVIGRLVDGEDYNEVIKEFDIQLFPTKVENLF